MGYYTSYTLEVEKYSNTEDIKKVSIDEVIKKVSQGGSKEDILNDLEHIKNGKKNIVVSSDMIIEEFVNSYENASYALTKSGGTRENSKWYEADKQLAEFSKKYPGWLFILYGEGEEAGDMWKNYYLNGKMQEAIAKITYDEFDEKKLKNLK